MINNQLTMNGSVEIIAAAGLTKKVKQVNGFVAKHKDRCFRCNDCHKVLR